MKRGIIVGAAPCDLKNLNPTSEDFVIAADGGWDHLQKAGLSADLLVGDFDSVTHLPSDIPLVRHPVRKDDTDLSLAIGEALKNGCQALWLYGVTGDRLDHTLANLQLLCGLSKENHPVFLCDDNCTITAITNGVIKFKPEATGIISIFSHSDRSLGVTLQGLSYPLDQAPLTSDFPLGVSNEFMGEEAIVQVTCGTLLIHFSGPPDWVIME